MHVCRNYHIKLDSVSIFPVLFNCQHLCPQSSVSEHVQRPSTASRRSAPLLNCEDVEMKVRPKIQDCWRQIQRRCRHADPEWTGDINVDAFLGTLLRPDILSFLFMYLSSAKHGVYTIMKSRGFSDIWCVMDISMVTLLLCRIKMAHSLISNKSYSINR